MSLSKDEKQQIMKSHSQVEGDTGSPEVQVALLTEQIKKLTGHLQEHGQDKNSRRGLLKMVSKRRRILNYLMKLNADRYKKLLTSVGLEK